jgi:large subunit ribosomal protein L23
MPEQAKAARTASTPRAVRLRRLRKSGRTVAPGAHDATRSDLTPTENATYRRRLATGQILEEHGKNLTDREWLERLNKSRERIRGVKTSVNPDGTESTQVVGQPIYLPNVVVRLVRNHTPEGQPYNPYEATFRIPQSITKTDVRSYLHSVYGVKTTYIRTDNYISPVYRNYLNGSLTRTKAHKTYKRAVVGLVEPFYPPQAAETFSKQAKEERQKWLEDNFQIQQTKELQKMEFLRMTRKGSTDWRWRGQASTSRKTILSRVVAQRYERDLMLAKKKELLQRARRA